MQGFSTDWESSTFKRIFFSRWFLHQWERLHSSRTISHGAMSESSEEEEEEEDEVQFEDDLEYLRFLSHWME